MIRYLSVEEILRLHFQVIEDFGGSHGVRNEGRIHSAANAPKQDVFGVDQYSGITAKAAVYLRNIIADHPFVDGNKRTAVTVAGIFLQRNGCKLSADPKELEDFVVSIAVEHYDIDKIATWLEARTTEDA